METVNTEGKPSSLGVLFQLRKLNKSYRSPEKLPVVLPTTPGSCYMFGGHSGGLLQQCGHWKVPGSVACVSGSGIASLLQAADNPRL